MYVSKIDYLWQEWFMICEKMYLFKRLIVLRKQIWKKRSKGVFFVSLFWPSCLLSIFSYFLHKNRRSMFVVMMTITISAVVW